MKKLAALILTGIMTLGCFSTAFAAETKVTVNGNQVNFGDAKPFVDGNGRTMVPLRPIAEAMNLNVYWEQSTQTACFSSYHGWGAVEKRYGATEYGEVEYEGIYVNFPIGSKTYAYEWNGLVVGTDHFVYDREEFTMDTAAVAKDGRTYAPVRYLAQHYGYDVGWDGATSTVTLTKNY